MIRLREDLDHPGYVAGRVYNTYRGPLTTSSVIGAINTLYFYTFRIFYPILLKTIRFYVSAGGAASSAKSAIWGNSSLSNRPIGAPIVVDNTGVDTSTLGEKTADVTDTVFGPGWYWSGMKFTGTLPSLLTASGANPGAGWLVGHTVITSAPSITGYALSDTYSNNMPTLSEGGVTTGSGSNIPIIGLGL